MKKSFLKIVVLIALLSAACSSNNFQSSADKSSVTNNTSIQQIQSAVPTAAESDFQQARDLAAQQCNNLQLVAYFKNFKPEDRGNVASGYKFVCDDNKFVSVDIKSTGQIQTRKLSNLYYRAIATNDWKVTLESAKNIALQNGGNDFTSKNAGAFLSGADLANTTKEGFKWTMDFESKDYHSELQIFINPTTGAVLGQKIY